MRFIKYTYTYTYINTYTTYIYTTYIYIYIYICFSYGNTKKNKTYKTIYMQPFNFYEPIKRYYKHYINSILHKKCIHSSLLVLKYQIVSSTQNNALKHERMYFPTVLTTRQARRCNLLNVKTPCGGSVSIKNILHPISSRFHVLIHRPKSTPYTSTLQIMGKWKPTTRVSRKETTKNIKQQGEI